MVEAIRDVFPHKVPESILSTLVDEGTRLQMKNNALPQYESAIPIDDLVSLFEPFLRQFNVPALPNSSLFYNLFTIIRREVVDIISVNHPSKDLIEELVREVDTRLWERLQGGKEYNAGNMIRCWAYLKALVWIALDCHDVPVPKDLSALRWGLGFRNGTVIDFLRTGCKKRVA